ncbi:MAG: aminodeoxychorismate synthase component I [Chloroflexi bacterium]|nr:aminodeoxychorismate synthase component I [Chloroflexota bacterium]
MRTLLVDNYDSFTFNLYQLIAEIDGEAPTVVRNDRARWSELRRLDFDSIVLSPGPGSPKRASDLGICGEVLLDAEVPILGVCLGHQALGHVFGARVDRAPEPMHGRLSPLYHDGSELFAGLPQGFPVVRYHSLAVREPLPPSLQRTAWTEDGVMMGLRHRSRPLWGVQFHPESICTAHGRDLLQRFLAISRRFAEGRLRSTEADEVDGSLASRRSVVPSQLSTVRSEASAVRLRTRRLETVVDPERAFVGLFGAEPYAFWLDSSHSEHPLSRFSFMGAAGGPMSAAIEYRAASRSLSVFRGGVVERREEALFDYLARELRRLRTTGWDLPFDFDGGFVGCFGYELKAECGGELLHHAPTPDGLFIFADRFLAVDRETRSTHLVAVVADGGAAAADRWLEAMERQLRDLPELPSLPGVSTADDAGASRFVLARPRDRYLRDVEACRAYLLDGESYEICLTDQIVGPPLSDPLTVYRALRRINPAPYAAYLRFGEVAVLSSSPERFLRLERGRRVEAKPIKGTSRRGASPREDASLAEALRSSSKERAENLMIVDLLRNDLGSVCEVGSVSVPKLMDVESYATVHQLVSTVRGRLRADLGPLDLIRAAFPGGSMTGAPKLRTMRIIDELEGRARGLYSGALGYLALNGTADLSIVIRTIVSTPDATSIGTGGAVVVQSDPEAEFDELLLKARALLEAIALAERGSAGVGGQSFRSEETARPRSR